MIENLEELNVSDDEPSIQKIPSFHIEKEKLNMNSIQSDEISYSIINNPIMNVLLEFGYEYKFSKKLISYLNPRSVEQAIEYLSVENGIIQHFFIEDLNNENKCKICEKTREEHLINEINSLSFGSNGYNSKDERNISINLNLNPQESRNNSFQANTHTIESRNNSIESKTHSIESRNNSFQPKSHSIESRNNSIESKSHSIESRNNSIESNSYSIELRNNSNRINNHTTELRNSIIRINQEIYPINYSNSKNNNSISKSDNYISKSISMKEISISLGETENRICAICDENYLKSNQTQLNNCLHTFCKTCWFTYIKNSIIEKKQIKIKCMDHLCNEILSETFIYTIIKDDKNLILKYNENKLREEIINNPNKKFCPYPNCNSYARRKDKNEKKVKCENGHLFCFYCLKEPHDNKECTRELDEKMEEYAKKKFIKKCPNCGCWTEKIEGCNHITCIECNYQWCWLCNNKYTTDHYTIGKCKGFQFFKPKNEEEIQLAFEGKIQLREDERMDFFFIDDDFFMPLRINRIGLRNDFIDDEFPNVFERRRFRRIFSYFIKFNMSIFFLFFGTIIVIICESGKYINKIKYDNRKSIVFLTTCYFISVISFGFSIFFIQIFFNLLSFIYVVILYSFNDFFEDLHSLITKIRNCNVFTGFGTSFLNFDFEFSSIVISFFFGCPFWIIKFIDHEFLLFNFTLNDYSNKKIFYTFYVLIIFILDFSMYPLTILLNNIGIIEETIRCGGFGFLSKHIKSVINGGCFDI